MNRLKKTANYINEKTIIRAFLEDIKEYMQTVNDRNFIESIIVTNSRLKTVQEQLIKDYYIQNNDFNSLYQLISYYSDMSIDDIKEQKQLIIDTIIDYELYTTRELIEIVLPILRDKY